MSKASIYKISSLALAMSLILSGCSLSFNTGTGQSSNSAADGGVFKSTTRGGAWEQKTLIQGVGSVRSFANIDILSLAMDPEDSRAIYAGSFDNGLFFTYNGGDSWQVATTLGKITINEIAVDPGDKCVIYAASANKLYKSSDCNRSWTQVYFDNDLTVKISALAIDNFNGANIFIGTSRGDIIKSGDGGGSWRALDRFDSQVDKIVASPNSARLLFAGTTSRGLYRSTDGGQTWVSLNDKLKAFDDIQRFRDLVLVKQEKTAVFMATNYGILKSTDEGESWSSIPLLTPEKEARINAIAVNPGNMNEMYYVTNTTFYRSLDGGKNWSSYKLPTNRAGSQIIVDPKNPTILYLAAKKLKS